MVHVLKSCLVARIPIEGCTQLPITGFKTQLVGSPNISFSKEKSDCFIHLFVNMEREGWVGYTCVISQHHHVFCMLIWTFSNLPNYQRENWKRILIGWPNREVCPMSSNTIKWTIKTAVVQFVQTHICMFHW